MDPKTDRLPHDQPTKPEPPPESPAPRKRFRIEKVEERIAPKKAGGSVGSSGSETSASGASVIYY